MAEEQEPQMETVNSGIERRSMDKEVRSFFEVFPRELRDCVYDLLFEHVEEHNNNLFLEAHASIPKLRLVSHQFKAEYEERCYTNDFDRLTATWKIPDESLEFSCVRHPLLLDRTINMTLVLSSWFGWNGSHSCWRNNSYTSVTAEAWLDDLDYMLPRLQRMRIIMIVGPCHETRVQALVSLVDTICYHRIKQLEFWTSIKDHPKPILLATWTRGQSWWKDEDAMISYFE